MSRAGCVPTPFSRPLNGGVFFCACALAQRLTLQDGAAHELAQRVERLLKMASRKDYYKILGVPKTAALPEIKRAYKKAALQW